LFLFVRRHHLPWLAMCDLVTPGLILGMALGRFGCFLNGCCYGGPSDLPWAVTFPWNTPPFVAQVQTGTLSVHGLSFGASGDRPPVIAAVEPDSQAARNGLKAGDLVQSINDAAVQSVDEAEMALLSIDNHKPDMSVSIRVAGDPRPHAWAVVGPLPRSRPVHPAQLYSAIDGLLLCGFLLAYSPFRRRDGEVFAMLLTIHPVSRFLLESIRKDENKNVWETGMTISQNVSVLLLVAGALLWAYLLLRPAKLAWQRQPVTAS
jgi:phosphatidylglycerol:prolipoprotein diacylglycerol transferase